MAPRQVPVPLRAARQGTQHSGTKLLSQPRDLIEPIEVELPTPFIV
jgi:hypothetical protein